MNNLIFIIPPLIVIVLFAICYMFIQDKEYNDNQENIEKLERLKALALSLDDKDTAEEIDKRISLMK